MNIKYNCDIFVNDLKELGIELSDIQINQFMIYYEKLVKKNEVMNLTSITEFNEVMKKHFIDSLSIVKYIPKINQINYKMIDIGTGAGFPGLPIKIAFPNVSIVLLDSLNKRIEFLKEMIEELKLDNINAVHGRAEEYLKDEECRESFDICVSRAVANLSSLSEYCLPYVKIGGYFLPYKSDKLNQEIKESGNAITTLGGQIEEIIEYNLPNSDLYRNILVIKKIDNTPIKYPRKAGMPTKKPLH